MVDAVVADNFASSIRQFLLFLNMAIGRNRDSIPRRGIKVRTKTNSNHVTALAKIQKRLANLERTVEELKSKMSAVTNTHRRWWVDDAGRFADDPIFDEIVRLGREYRESLRPGRKTRKK
jgi:hypothetical protein